MPILDIFSNNAFSVVSLTDAINKVPFVPGRIGQLGLFNETGIVTTSVMIEEREGSLNLIETSSRGRLLFKISTTNAKRDPYRSSCRARRYYSG